MSIEQQQLLVNKQDLADTRWATSAVADPAPGEVVLEVEYFALTANNITYAVAGDSMNYWNFFPAEEGWGRVPVWGFGRVVASAHDEVPVGNRYYGYYPMGSHLTIKADKVSPRSLVDVAEHRAGLAEVYNQYSAAGPANETADAAEMLYRPLYMTSFMLADFAEHNGYFGARSVILTSASSKTSLGLAFLLSRLEGIEVIGLTSPTNTDFVVGLGTYDRVVTYDQVATLDASVPSMIIDMAGNGEVLAAVHAHFQDALQYSCLVGATHWQARGGARELAGPKPELFFAPSHIAQRTKDWGPGGLQQRFQSAWDDFLAVAGNWIEIERHQGPEAVRASYEGLLRSQVSPNKGLVLSV